MAVSVGPVASKSPSLPLRAPHRETPAGQRDWLVFSIIGWDFRIQRPQHLARELSRTGNATFYIEPHFIADAQAGYQIRQIDAHLPLYAVTLHLDGAPQIYFKAADTGQQEQLRQSLALLMQDWGIEACTAMVEHPYWTPVVLSMPNTVRIYDCMDHHEGFGGMPQDLVDLEHALMQQSDGVTVTSQWLHEWARDKGVATSSRTSTFSSPAAARASAWPARWASCAKARA